MHFYSPTCGHCRKLQPVLQAVAAELIREEDVVVASCVATLPMRCCIFAAECTVADHRAARLLLRRMDAVANDVPGLEIEGFPTLMMFTKKNKRGVQYDGSRDAHDILQFIKDSRAGHVHVGGLHERAEVRADEQADEQGSKVEL